MLVPPDNFGLVEPGLYRCSKLESAHFPFLKTLDLKTILLLDAENPPRPLKTFINDNNINLINLGGLKVTNHNHTGTNNNVPSNRADDDDQKSIHSNQGSPDISGVSSPQLSRDSRDSKSSTNTGTFADGVVELNLQLINLNNTTKKNDQWMLIERNLIKKAFEFLLNQSKYNILVVDGTSTLVSILRSIQKWNFNSIVNEFRIYTGNSAKSNYFAENFLELIDIELIPYEIDQLNQFIKLQNEEHLKNPQNANTPLTSSPEMFRTMSWHKNSIDDESLWEKEMDEEDFDDDLLSASPQIPENLLKMVEKKRQNSLELSDEELSKSITPGTSPRLIGSQITTSGGRFSHSFDKRRPSLDKRPNPNPLFRNSLSNYSINNLSPGSLSSRPSGENLNPHKRYSKTERRLSIRPEDLNDFEEKRIREKYDFKYYKNLNKATNFAAVGTIKLKLPPNNKLPGWFIRGRDFWETSSSQ